MRMSFGYAANNNQDKYEKFKNLFNVLKNIAQ